MNEQIQGVYVYGGGPRRHYVFSGQAQREKRQFTLKLLLTIVLFVVFAWCMRLAYIAIAEPPQATADTAPISQIQLSESEPLQQPNQAQE